jgi:hypothetical protein
VVLLFTKVSVVAALKKVMQYERNELTELEALTSSVRSANWVGDYISSDDKVFATILPAPTPGSNS